jgi:hypothetical protein
MGAEINESEDQDKARDPRKEPHYRRSLKSHVVSPQFYRGNLA